MYHIELAFRPLVGSVSDLEGETVVNKFVGTTETREEADIMTEMLCDRIRTVYVNLWHETPGSDPVLVAQCDGFHS